MQNKLHFIQYNHYVLHFDIMMMFFFCSSWSPVEPLTSQSATPKAAVNHASHFPMALWFDPKLSHTVTIVILWLPVTRILFSCNIRCWLDSSITKGKRSIMFDQSLRVKNAAGPWWEHRIPDASDLFFEEVPDPTASTQPTMLKSQTNLTWRVTQSLLSQRRLKSRPKGSRSAG